MHFISSIEIKNFRSCEHLKIELSKFTPIVGYNNAGKSNILSAIQWLIKKESLKEKDFFNNSNFIEVIGIINGITNDLLNKLETTHKNKIEKFVDNEKIKIRRTQSNVNKVSLDLWDFELNKWQVNPTGIDNAIKALFPDSIRIGAMENATEDSSKSKTSTTIGKLLNEFIKPIREKHEVILKSHLDTIQELISAQGTSRLPELNEFDQSINDKLKDFFPDISLKIDINAPSFDEIFKDGGTIRVYENGNEGRDCSAYGHGAQRSIQMALIRHLADIKNSDNESFSTTLLLIDEPELYLHPFAIEQAREALKILSNNGYQVLFSTHSPQMITANDAQNTLLVRKENHSTKVRERLNEAITNTVPDSSSQEELLFSLTHSSQILFSEMVILAEGITERRLLPPIFEKISQKTLGQEKIAFVQLGGVASTPKSMKVLKAMDLPVKAIVDLDYILSKQARQHDGIDTDSECFRKIHDIFKRLENENKVKIRNGAPTKFDGNSEKPFTVLALEDDAKELIQEIHELFKSKNVWVWKDGDIEKVLGLNNKEIETHSRFSTHIKENDITQLDFYDELRSLVDWLRSS